MKRLAASLILSTFSSLSLSSEMQTWEFVYVSRSTTLGIDKGTAKLVRDGTGLTGLAEDETTGEYYLKLSVHGNSVSGRFGATESDDGGTDMHGTLSQWQTPDPSGCWETIQLYDVEHSVTLARNIPLCPKN